MSASEDYIERWMKSAWPMTKRAGVRRVWRADSTALGVARAVVVERCEQLDEDAENEAWFLSDTETSLDAALGALHEQERLCYFEALFPVEGGLA